MYAHASHDDVSNRALMKGRDKIRELEEELEKYKRVNAKLERMAKWNLRSSRSALTTTEEMLQVLQDTFGDEAFEKND
jgi:sugar-specific transcriptional regulator TrmB